MTKKTQRLTATRQTVLVRGVKTRRKVVSVRPKRPTGTVVYDGPSAINGERIVGIVTYDSDNPKTGDMSQLWILDAGDIKPSDVVKQGRDGSVCGDCAFASGKGCYVNTAHAPNGVWKAWKAGRYASGLPTSRAKAIRLGAYGDPAALPYDVVAQLVERFEGHTGYTHQWRTCDQRFRKCLMASTESTRDTAEANFWGWRTARVGTAQTHGFEIVCPATEEGGRRTTCDKCQLCNGWGRAISLGAKQPKNILFPAHGSRKAKALIQIGEVAA